MGLILSELETNPGNDGRGLCGFNWFNYIVLIRVDVWRQMDASFPAQSSSSPGPSHPPYRVNTDWVISNSLLPTIRYQRLMELFTCTLSENWLRNHIPSSITYCSFKGFRAEVCGCQRFLFHCRKHHQGLRSWSYAELEVYKHHTTSYILHLSLKTTKYTTGWFSACSFFWISFYVS